MITNANMIATLSLFPKMTFIFTDFLIKLVYVSLQIQRNIGLCSDVEQLN
jgi:hypothetical protein